MNTKNKKHAQVFHFDLFGKRNEKYDFLENNSIDSVEWKELEVKGPNYFFVKKDFEGMSIYEKGIRVDQLFPVNSVGIVTSKDAILIADSKELLINQVENYYNVQADPKLIQQLAYRTFDQKFIYYDLKLVDRARDKVMQHLLKPNVSLIAPKQAIKGFRHIFTGNMPCDKNYVASAGLFGAGNVFPLYLYPETNSEDIFSSQKRIPNLNPEIINEISKKLKLEFIPEIAVQTGRDLSLRHNFAPINILDYIYAVLHSPNYREKYKEFLKIDFPRVPYPKNAETFWQLVKIGGEIRALHLLESPKINEFTTTYPQNGDNTVTRKMTKTSAGWEATNSEKTIGRVWINDNQYFDNIPLIAWEFYIGGYQPAQKWLKDRNGRTLTFEDILHYQKIIVALTETNRLMKAVDEVGVE